MTRNVAVEDSRLGLLLSYGDSINDGIDNLHQELPYQIAAGVGKATILS